MSDIALKIGSFLAEVVTVFAVCFITSYVLSAIRHGRTKFDVEATLRLAITLGILLPLWTRMRVFF